MPVWHEATRRWVKEGRLALLGVTQEQHADRCQLFAQWKRFDWPILHDPINLLEAPAVPIIVAIDEYGIVRAVRPRPETFAAEFLDKRFGDDAPLVPRSSDAPDPGSLFQKAKASPGADAWRVAGDALTIWGGAERLDQAIDAYTRALACDPSDKNSLFRLGVAYRMRHESAERRNGDFQSAVEAWGAPWNSTRTSTSGVAASSSTGRASPSRTLSTTGSSRPGPRSPAAGRRPSPSLWSPMARSSPAQCAMFVVRRSRRSNPIRRARSTGTTIA